MPIHSLPVVTSVAANTTMPWRHSLSIATAAWSASALAKVFLMDRRTSWIAPASATSNERYCLNTYHLLVAVLVRRIFRPNLLKQRVSLRQHGLRAAFCMLLLVLLDEYIQWTMTRSFERARTRFVCVGRPAPADKTDDDCFVCQGVGIGDWQPSSHPQRQDAAATATNTNTTTTSADHDWTSTAEPSDTQVPEEDNIMAKDAERAKQRHTRPVRRSTAYATTFDTETLHAEHHMMNGDNTASADPIKCSQRIIDDNDDGDDRLESFCFVSDHVAHRACMRAWWLSQHYRQNEDGTPIAREIDPMVASMTGAAPDTGATVFGGIRRVPHPPTHMTRCPCCRRRLKFTVRLSRANPTEHLLSGQMNIASWAKQSLINIQWRQLSKSFLVHLFSTDTAKRTGLSIGFYFISFCLAALGTSRM
jgi:hypothetical protein